MKSFDRLIAVFVLLAAVMLAAVNIILLQPENDGGRLYLVEVSRVVRAISDTGEIPDISGYEAITGVYAQGDDGSFFYADGNCIFREVNGKLYRIEYAVTRDNSRVILADIIITLFAAAVTGLLLYIRAAVIKPFGRISELPLELAKGIPTEPLKENSRKRYFGRFIWGLDMLREKLESAKQSELAMQKEKKTMLMSLSHDIKTPLSAIKLYSAALSKGIYADPEKQRNAAESINAKADEIEHLVNDIMKSGAEDLIRFDVKNGEFYLSEVTEKIRSYYRDRLTGTDFTVAACGDCIIHGDPDRLTEVLQNIIENAIKYGDGRSISISFADEEDCRLVTVANSGCTLPEEELSYIFDSFRRGTNVGFHSGNGLGLYICRQLMTAMNGDIFAEVRGGEMLVTVVCRKNA